MREVRLMKKAQGNFVVIGVILVVLVIVVLVGVLVSFNWKADASLQACHDSALLRGAAASALGGSLKNVVSLTCQTKRICVVSDNQKTDSCSTVLGAVGKYTKLTVTGNNDSKREQIKMSIAREMASCWNTLGEGNLQIFARELTDNSVNAQAVVCSRFYFDPLLVKEIGENLTGFNDYLLRHQSPNRAVSYWDYFRNTPDGDTLQIIAGNTVQTAGSTTESFASAEQSADVMNLSKQKAVMYIEFSQTTLGARIGNVVGAAGAAYMLYGFAGGKAGSALAFIGTTIGVGGKTAQAVTIAGASMYAGSITDSWYTSLFTNFQKGQPEVSGLFLRDYSAEDFTNLQKDNLQFNNIP